MRRHRRRRPRAGEKEQSPCAARFDRSRRDRDESPQTKPEVPEDGVAAITPRDGLGRTRGRSLHTTPVQGRVTNGRTSTERI